MQTAEQSASHTIAIQTFEGETQIIEADELRVCLPNKACIQFWVMIITCFAMVVIGIVFMTAWDPLSPYFFIGEAMMTTALGILIPSPDYKKVFGAKKTEASAPAPRYQNADNPHNGQSLSTNALVI